MATILVLHWWPALHDPLPPQSSLCAHADRIFPAAAQSATHGVEETDLPRPMDSSKIQWEVQDPKMEVLVLYHIFGHVLGGYSLKFSPEQ